MSRAVPPPMAHVLAIGCLLLARLVPVAKSLRAEVASPVDPLPGPPWTDNAPVLAADLQLQLMLKPPSIFMNHTPARPAASGFESRIHVAKSSQLLLQMVMAWLRKEDRGGCWDQLGGLLSDLNVACVEASPKEHYIFKYYEPALPEKDCVASAMDIFIYGQRLVEALQVPEEQVEQKRVSPELAPLVQSLYFLRSWLVPLATTSHSAMLWAGFWDGDPENRTTQQALFEFAAATDHETMHPSTELGRLIERHGQLSHCYSGETMDFMNNMWSFCSMSFVMGMKSKAQGTVVAVVNKAMEGQRALQQSVLFQHEFPTLGVAAWGLGFWAPEVIVLDLLGTCAQTSPALRQQLFARLGPWWAEKQKLHWSLEDFARRSELEWRCVDCPECRLDSHLAQHVARFIEARGFKSFRALRYEPGCLLKLWPGECNYGEWYHCRSGGCQHTTPSLRYWLCMTMFLACAALNFASDRRRRPVTIPTPSLCSEVGWT